MKSKTIIVVLCSLLASGAGAVEDVKDMGKQIGIRSMLENPVKKAARIKKEVVQLQQDLKRFVSAYEAKKISLEQLRNFYEKRVKSFCLYYHKLSENEWAVLLNLPSGFHVRAGFLWDMRVRLNQLTALFMNEDREKPLPFTGRNNSYTGPKEVVALKVFSDGMDYFLEWMEIFKDRMGGSLLAPGAGAAEDVKDMGKQT